MAHKECLEIIMVKPEVTDSNYAPSVAGTEYLTTSLGDTILPTYLAVDGERGMTKL